MVFSSLATRLTGEEGAPGRHEVGGVARRGEAGRRGAAGACHGALGGRDRLGRGGGFGGVALRVRIVASAQGPLVGGVAGRVVHGLVVWGGIDRRLAAAAAASAIAVGAGRGEDGVERLDGAAARVAACVAAREGHDQTVVVVRAAHGNVVVVGAVCV